MSSQEKTVLKCNKPDCGNTITVKGYTPNLPVNWFSIIVVEGEPGGQDWPVDVHYCCFNHMQEDIAVRIEEIKVRRQKKKKS